MRQAIRFWTLLLTMFVIIGPLSAEQYSVTVSNFSFSPNSLTISEGDTVVWHSVSGFHNVRHLGNPRIFGNDPASAPWTYSFIFRNVGDSTFHYDCEIHPASMKGTITVSAPNSVKTSDSALPAGYGLGQNYPNPFNSTTDIAFSLPQESQVSLRIYDLVGREISILAEGVWGAGEHHLSWSPIGLASGIYLLKMETSTFNASRKMTYLK
jgi:plastocyanin